jgi:hypothetical protein
LPVGFVEFTATPQQQSIPSKGGWLPDWKSERANFPLLFKNASNLRQQVNVQLQGKDRRKSTYKVLPEDADLDLGETTKVLLEVSTKRPWIGLGKTLQLEARALLSDQRLGSTDPATQSLELRVLPVVPLWLLLAAIALLAALLALILRPAPIAHTDLVNSVRFSSNAVLVVSGSDDCSIRRWQVNGNHLEPRDIFKGSSVACNGKSLQPRGLLALSDKAVRALRFDPVEEQRVAAGLENGVIQLQDVATGEQKDELKDPTDRTSDRVFDLVFTNDSRFLFSGHGSGKVRVWVRQSPNSKFQLLRGENLRLSSRLNHQVRALALSPDESILASAGQFKRLILWDRSLWERSDRNSRPRRVALQELSGRQGQNDYIWGIAFAPGARKLLASSDSDGYITIWNLDQCQDINTTSQLDEPITQKCVVHDRWSAAKMSVRSIAFDLDSRKLVSAGDDGRVIVWPLTPDGKLDRQKAVNGWEIYKSPKKLNSIDLTKDNQGTTIVSGGDDFQVKLHRLR